MLTWILELWELWSLAVMCSVSLQLSGSHAHQAGLYIYKHVPWQGVWQGSWYPPASSSHPPPHPHPAPRGSDPEDWENRRLGTGYASGETTEGLRVETTHYSRHVIYVF
jgi:hypothetical protein